MAHKILVVDDTQVIRDFLQEVLTDSGYSVDLASDGKTGCQMALDNDYDIIFCDVHMPVMNGLDLVKKIRQTKPDAAIVMTDSLPGKIAEEATAAGAICCLAKPFALDDLRDVVERLGGAKKSRTK